MITGITNIIFSKNRAMQLHALLETILVRCNIFENNVVIYTHDEMHAKSYDLLIDRFPKVTWIKETILKENILQAMKTQYTCFMCDDDIIFDGFIGDVTMCDKTFCYSLRLGHNVNNNIGQQWNWRQTKTAHYNYAFSTDGHIYSTDVIKPMVSTIRFDNPNVFESAMFKHADSFPPLMRSPELSVLTSFSVNRVSDKSHCATSNQYRENELHTMYLEGYLIDWANMDMTGVDKPIYEEYELKFKIV